METVLLLTLAYGIGLAVLTHPRVVEGITGHPAPRRRRGARRARPRVAHAPVRVPRGMRDDWRARFPREEDARRSAESLPYRG